MKKNEKLKLQPYYPVPLLTIKFYSYLVENSQKATLNFHFKLRFSVKRTKFQIYFAKDCVASKFSLQLTTLTFWTKFSQKRTFLIGNKKKTVNITIWIKFAQEESFQSKTKKLNNIIEFSIFELV